MDGFLILSGGSIKKVGDLLGGGGGVLQMKCSDQVLRKAKQQKAVGLAKHQPSAVCWKDWGLEVLVTSVLSSKCGQFRVLLYYCILPCDYIYMVIYQRCFALKKRFVPI